MSHSIFSLQRAFSAKRHMALAAGNVDNFLAAMKAKDMLDSIHLGLFCEAVEFDDYCKSTAAVDEFIADCKNILVALSTYSDDIENDHITIQLLNNRIDLSEENGALKMKMDGEQVTLLNLTLQDLYKNLLNDIQSNPELYGSCLTKYVNSLEETEPPG